jgi:hypothetical protein
MYSRGVAIVIRENGLHCNEYAGCYTGFIQKIAGHFFKFKICELIVYTILSIFYNVIKQVEE